MSKQEWQVRIDLAAAYRLATIYGWTDLNNTHFSVRIPGDENQFLLNPFGMLFDEITASSLIKVDHEGNIIGASDYPANPAGFVIHGAVHMGVPDANCIIHTHSRFGTAVATQKNGLLPSSQKALTLMGWIGYHDFEGAALDMDERPRILNDLGDKKILILRNHGLMSRVDVSHRDGMPDSDRCAVGRLGAEPDIRIDPGAHHRAGTENVRRRRIHPARPRMADPVAPVGATRRHAIP
jgi:ribulose-5-phosphate 4-epimerase/fuculose-1-phosphate aldolase